MWRKGQSSGNDVLIVLLPAALLGFADIRFSVGGRGVFTLSPFEVWSYLVLPILIWKLGIASFSARRVLESSCWCLLAYVVWALVPATLFWNVGEGHPIPIDYKRMLSVSIVGLAVVTLVERPRDFRLVMIAWFTAGLINAPLALSQMVRGGPYPLGLAETASEKLGWSGDVAAKLVTGFFIHPNVLAQVMLPLVVVATSVVLARGAPLSSRRAMWLLLAVMLGTVLAATAAKGPLPWAIAGVLVAVSLERWPCTRRLWILGLAWMALVVGTFVAAFALAYAFDVASLRTILPRLEFVVLAFTLFVDHPVTAMVGGGLGRWDEYAGAASWQWIDAHNVFLNQVLMYGWIGLLLLVLFLVLAVRRSLSAVGAPRGVLSPYPFVGAIFAMTGSYFFEPSFHDLIEKHQLVFTVALSLTAARLSESARRPMEKNAPVATV